MANVKKFEDFVKENTENKGKGVGGDTDLIPRPTPKQTINRGDLNPVDQLGIAGRQITTDKIDGIVKSVKDDTVYVEDRLTKKIKEFTVKEFLSEFHKSYKKEKKEEKKNESVIVEKEPELSEEDKEILGKILNVNETQSSKELWEKKWESFATNYVKKMKDVDEDFEEFSENAETISLQELSEAAITPKDEEKVDEKPQDEDIQENKSDIKVQKFQSFINDRIKIKPDTIEEDINLDEDDEETIGIAENSVPKPKPQVECVDCGQKVDDEEFDKVRHLYSKHNYKATVDDLTKWLLKYFPPEVPEKKKK